MEITYYSGDKTMRIVFMFGGMLNYFFTAKKHPFGQDHAWAKFTIRTYSYDETVKLIKKL